MKSLLILPFLLSAVAQADSSFQLIARSGQYDSFQLSAPSYLSNTALQINDLSTISFIYTGFDERTSEFHQRVYSVDRQGLGRDRYQAAFGFYLSAPSQNDKNEILVYQHNEGLNDGLWKISASGVEQVVSPKDFPSAQTFSSAKMNNQGEYFWRELNYDGVRSFVFKSDEVAILARDNDGERSYLFTPEMTGNWVASKVRFGNPLDFQEERIDKIIRWNKETREEVTVAVDRDTAPESIFKSFHNNLGMNSLGEIVFVANRVDKTKAVFFWRNSQYQLIAEEGDKISEIETFSPVVNNLRTIAFRAKDESAKRSLFVWNEKFGLKKILSEGDLLTTDRETGRVLDSSWGPGFSGQIALNNLNELVFTVVLESKNGEQRLGSGIYKVKISEEFF